MMMIVMKAANEVTLAMLIHTPPTCMLDPLTLPSRVCEVCKGCVGLQNIEFCMVLYKA